MRGRIVLLRLPFTRNVLPPHELKEPIDVPTLWQQVFLGKQPQQGEMILAFA